MALSLAIALLSLIIATVALWTVNEISNKVMRQSRELLNHHVIEITRQTNAHNDKISRMKTRMNLIDAELQTYRQEFRKDLQDKSKDIKKLTGLLSTSQNRRVKPRPPKSKPPAS